MGKSKKEPAMALDVFEGSPGAELLQDTFLFRNLNFGEAQALSRLCHNERRKKGEVVIEEGSLGQALYLVRSGQVKVLKGEGAQTEELAELGPSELFGEMSLIEDALTSASVVAATEVELLVIQRADFEDLLGQNASLALKIYKSFCRTLSERLRRTSSDLGASLAQVRREDESQAPSKRGPARKMKTQTTVKTRKKGARS
jgi:CRP/FNR family transcriptional regulator, cyclic AMP receptor protein